MVFGWDARHTGRNIWRIKCNSRSHYLPRQQKALIGDGNSQPKTKNDSKIKHRLIDSYWRQTRNHRQFSRACWRYFCHVCLIGCSKILGDMGIRVFWEELFALIAGRPSELPKSCVFCCGQASKGGQGVVNSTGVRATFGGPATTENTTFWQFWGSPCDQGGKFFKKNSDSHIPKNFGTP